MAEKILTVEELEDMMTTEPKSESGHAESMMRIDGSLRELKNKRTRSKTLDDALDAFDGLIAEAYKIREIGLEGQVATFMSIGRAGTHNTLWRLPAEFHNSIWLIADHEGAQTLRNQVLGADYGMSLADHYKPLVKAHNATLAVLRKEQADMKFQAQMEQAQRSYENELESIEGDD